MATSGEAGSQTDRRPDRQTDDQTDRHGIEGGRVEKEPGTVGGRGQTIVKRSKTTGKTSKSKKEGIWPETGRQETGQKEPERTRLKHTEKQR